MTRQPAPIALFAYRRLAHLSATVATLRDNALASESALYVFCDGPSGAEDEPLIAEVRAFVRQIDGFKSVTIIEAQENMGLARSITSGVSRMLEAYPEVIVLEDDLVSSPYFLIYMNDGLSCYRDNLQVGSIQGYVYPGVNALPETFFMLGGGSWGWATWRRAWATFERDGNKLLDALELSGRVDDFDLGGLAPYTRYLRKTILGMQDSWVTLWHASCFLNDLYALHPARSLVQNIGMDGTGRHCPATDAYRVALTDRPIKVEPVPVAQNEAAVARYCEHFLANNWAMPTRPAGILARLRQSALSWIHTAGAPFGHNDQ